MQRVTFSEKSYTGGGHITAPPSKSNSHRLLFLALIAKQPISISHLLSANDVEFTLQACKQFGMQVEGTSPSYKRYIPPKELISDELIFNCGNSGTTVRFLIGLSLVISGKIHLTGEFFVRNRPLIPMLEAMKTIGTEYTVGENGITIETPKIVGSKIKIPGHFSSQFISGLVYGIIGLMMHPEVLLTKKVNFTEFTIETTTPPVSFPYLELTQHIFEEFGIKLQFVRMDNKCLRVRVPIDQNTDLIREDYDIPGDFSSIAPILCGNALFGDREMRIKRLSESGFQTDSELLDILRDIGVDLETNDGEITFFPLTTHRDKPRDLSIDCIGNPDLFPILCVMGCYLPGTTALTHINHIRFKESDRVAEMVRILQGFGVQIEERENSVVIQGKSQIELNSSHIFSDIHDHRVLMALIVFALGVEYNGNKITVENVEYIADSYPKFLQVLHYQNAKYDLEEIK
ncbi:MAG: 3-phosphoshikimate 1-carboxyvinyltransferase [Promethearchaeota archaeon]